MAAGMVVTMGALSESLSAEATLERPLVRVYAHMLGKIGEALPAILAEESTARVLLVATSCVIETDNYR